MRRSCLKRIRWTRRERTLIDKYTGETVTIGRRKDARARVRIKPGSGNIVVNGRPIREYLARDVLVMLAQQPFEVTETQGRFDVRVRVNGGGLSGQAGAIRLGISRALLEYDANYKGVLRSAGLLTRDAREVERKKPGQPGARKRFQFSKR
ncbi:MAG: 30S ribosomal protein S9 [Candidatus Hydrogenedentes bacterium]|nr:30S ribosomal protein S9 [Candidatus Hydrogenedentota bacterium]